MTLWNLLRRARPADSVRPAYESIVAAARHPDLYAKAAVPDTLDGRYDMIILHMILVLDRLKAGGEEGAAFAQELVDLMFADMDRSLREMGVGDLSVGKKVRRMGEVYYGRVQAYDPALRDHDDAALAAALSRNIYPDVAPPDGALSSLVVYVRRAIDTMAALPFAAIRAGELDFGELP